MKKNDPTSVQQAGQKITILNDHRQLTRPTAYDKAIAFGIADRLGEGEDVEAILAEPGMPDQDTFFWWLEENPEASHRLRVKQQVREVLADQEKQATWTGGSAQASFCCRRRRAKASRPPHAATKPGRPAPTIGPGTGAVESKRAPLFAVAFQSGAEAVPSFKKPTT